MVYLAIPIVVIYFVLVQYAVGTWRPLRGAYRLAFKLLGGPILIAAFLAGIWIASEYFPNLIVALGPGNSGTSKGRAHLVFVLFTPLPFFAIWGWHRLLLSIQSQSDPDENIPFELGIEELSPDRIDMQEREPIFGVIHVIRPKELTVISEYFYITLNGEVLAALKQREYTKLNLDREVNELGCYAVPSRDLFSHQYKHNSLTCTSASDGTIYVSVSSDIIVGSSIKRLTEREAVKLKKKCKLVEAGGRNPAELNDGADHQGSDGGPANQDM